MPIRTSKSEHEYPMGVKRQPGERFEVEEQHVALLEALGRIHPTGEDGSQPEQEAQSAPRRSRKQQAALQ